VRAPRRRVRLASRITALVAGALVLFPPRSLAGAVDLGTVRADLLAAVGNTLEPAQAWLWLDRRRGSLRTPPGG
jgi:hypothetical protein